MVLDTPLEALGLPVTDTYGDITDTELILYGAVRAGGGSEGLFPLMRLQTGNIVVCSRN
jgi:hypothetical protein